MYRYRVEFIVNDKVVATTYRSGWTRADAYHAAIDSKEYAQAWEIAKRKSSSVFWDATKLNPAEESEWT